LASARVTASLDQALEHCVLVIGSSARRRHLTVPELDPRQAAIELLRASTNGPVAMLFGNERTGLENAELDRCHFLSVIPTMPEFSSLNVAQAIQLYCYELHQAARGLAPTSQTPTYLSVLGENLTPTPVGAEVMEHFFGHLEATLHELEFLDPQNPRHLMTRLRRLFLRATPDASEIHILRGVLAALGKKSRALPSRRR
jgi:TrmH family RNA methyltransferase